MPPTQANLVIRLQYAIGNLFVTSAWRPSYDDYKKLIGFSTSSWDAPKQAKRQQAFRLI